ncbi:hypothetical protein ACI77O_12920 [Pseudomonas tritici]|uniref:hypothetical protein n=1 Tax=Pseudomonas tritici TaxID=2745518 RepID=UPI00387B789F
MDSTLDDLESLSAELEGLKTKLKDRIPHVAQARRSHFQEPNIISLAVCPIYRSAH